SPVLKSTQLPTAHTPPPATPLTPLRLSSLPRFGLGTTFQAEPFHLTVAVALPSLLVPTAHAAAGPMLVTADRLMPGSVADTVHFDPSECSITAGNDGPAPVP